MFYSIEGQGDLSGEDNEFRVDRPRKAEFMDGNGWKWIASAVPDYIWGCIRLKMIIPPMIILMPIK